MPTPKRKKKIMGLLKVVLEESEAFRQAYAAAVPEKKKTRSILKEAASEDTKKLLFDINSNEFKEALKQIPDEVVDLIYAQLKIQPRRLVEIVEEQSLEDSASENQNEFISDFDQDDASENEDD